MATYTVKMLRTFIVLAIGLACLAFTVFGVGQEGHTILLLMMPVSKRNISGVL